MVAWRSSVYAMNLIKPRTDPCGTPQVSSAMTAQLMNSHSEYDPSGMT